MARILIVDDEPDVRELFNITLKMAGHVTETAKHGLEAVDRLGSGGDMPELIVLDLMMPHLDGFGLLNHIRNELSTKPVRVLVATAKVLEDSDQEKLGSWPVVGVLNKGELDIGQMVIIVSTALTQNPLKEGAAAKAEAAPAAETKDSADAPKTDAPAVAPATPSVATTPAAPASPAVPPADAAKDSAPAPKDGTSTPGSH